MESVDRNVPGNRGRFRLLQAPLYGSAFIIPFSLVQNRICFAKACIDKVLNDRLRLCVVMPGAFIRRCLQNKVKTLVQRQVQS
jgi:hypothetical protein